MAKLKEIQNLLATKNSVLQGLAQYNKEITEPKCDKYNIGFNIDNRFSTGKIEISIDSYTGYYGDSGVGRVLNIQNFDTIFKPNFIKMLNKHFEELLKETAELIKEQAKTLKEQALQELNDEYQKIEAL